MGHRALALPKAEPLLHVPISSIVELVSNRSEAEVLIRIGDLAHEFDHLTSTLVQWLEHQQCLRTECGEQLTQDAGDSPLVSSLSPLRYQARAVNRHGVRVLQQRITECLQQLQRHMNAVQVFANQNASFSQELRLCGILPRAEQRRRLAETESALAGRLSKFLSGRDGFYDEPPLLSLVTRQVAEATAAGGAAAGATAAVAAAESDTTAEAEDLRPAATSATERAAAAAGPAAAGLVGSTATQEGEHVCREASKRRPACDHTGGPNHRCAASSLGVVGRKRPALPSGGGGESRGRSGAGSGGFGGAGVAGELIFSGGCFARGGKERELSQELKSKGEDDDEEAGGFAAPSFLTPPLAPVAPTDGGSGNSTRGGGGGSGSGGGGGGDGPVAAPPSACSSVGSTPSSASLSPALAVACPLPLPTRSSPRRSATGENRHGASRKRARVVTPAAPAADGEGGGGSSGGGRVAAAAAATASAATAVGVHEEQLQSSGSCSPTPPSTREPSPPPLSTQEGSASPGDGGESDGREVPRAHRPNTDQNDIVTRRTDTRGEQGKRAAGGTVKGPLFGFPAPHAGPGGAMDGVVAGGGDDATVVTAGPRSTSAAVPACPPDAGATRGPGAAGGDGCEGVSESVLRVPGGAVDDGDRVAAMTAPQKRDTVDPRPGQRGGIGEGTGTQEGKRRASGVGESESESGEQEEEDEEDEEEDTAETVEDSALPTAELALGGAALASPPTRPVEAPGWGSQDGADEAGGVDAELGGGVRAGQRGGSVRDARQYSPR